MGFERTRWFVSNSQSVSGLFEPPLPDVERSGDDRSRTHRLLVPRAHASGARRRRSGNAFEGPRSAPHRHLLRGHPRRRDRLVVRPVHALVSVLVRARGVLPRFEGVDAIRTLATPEFVGLLRVRPRVALRRQRTPSPAQSGMRRDRALLRFRVERTSLPPRASPRRAARSLCVAARSREAGPDRGVAVQGRRHALHVLGTPPRLSTHAERRQRLHSDVPSMDENRSVAFSLARRDRARAAIVGALCRAALRVRFARAPCRVCSPGSRSIGRRSFLSGISEARRCTRSCLLPAKRARTGRR